MNTSSLEYGRKLAIRTLIGTVIVQFGVGSLYAWSMFNFSLATKLHSPVTTVALVFGIAMLFLSIASSLSGKLQEKMGLRKVLILAAVLFLIATWLTGIANNIVLLYISGGVILGFADGLVYLMTLTNSVKWFPKKRGVAAAFSIGAYGIGALVFKYINLPLLQKDGLTHTMFYWGIMVFVLVIIGLCLQYDSNKEASFQAIQEDAQKTMPKKETNKNLTPDFSLSEAVKTNQYYLLTVIFFGSMMSGLYAIGLAKDLGTGLAHMDAISAATSITIIAIFNLVGRFAGGFLSDKVTRIRIVSVCQILTIIGMIILLFTHVNVVTFYIALAFLALAFGATITIYPTIISEFFGLKNLAKNYGLLYLGFGIASLVASGIAAATGGYVATFYVILILSIIGLVMSIAIRRPKKVVLTETIES